MDALLVWRASNWNIGTKQTAITFFWPYQFITVNTLIKKLASIYRHFFLLPTYAYFRQEIADLEAFSSFFKPIGLDNLITHAINGGYVLLFRDLYPIISDSGFAFLIICLDENNTIQLVGLALNVVLTVCAGHPISNKRLFNYNILLIVKVFLFKLDVKTWV